MSTAPETNKRARRPRAVQPDLPGELSDRRIKDIHAAAEEYVAARDERMRLTTEEVDAKKRLGAAMKRHNMTSYSFEGIQVTVEEETVEVIKVKVAKHKDGDE